MPEKTLILWDYDGTLLDNAAAMAKAAHAAFAVFGIPVDLPRFQDTFTIPVTDMYRTLLNGRTVTDAEMQQSLLAFRTEMQKQQASLALRPRTEEVLQQLKENGHDMAVISNHQENALVEEIEAFGIRRFFNTVSGRSNATNAIGVTTKEERVLRYLEQEGVHPSQAIIIGDTLEEHGIAERTGVQCISIAGGSVSEQRLRAGGCKNIVHRMEDIPATVAKLLTPA